jgi:hypothetical protein
MQCAFFTENTPIKPMIKRLLPALAMIPAAALCAADRPDGLLGTDYIIASAQYSNVDMGYYQSGLDLDYAGVGLWLNKHITNFQGAGIDVGFFFSNSTNQNYTSQYSRDSNDYELLVTLFKVSDGVFTPYFSAIAGYEKEDFKDKVVNYKENYDTGYFGGEAGVEVHLLPGLSFTPYLDYLVAEDGDLGSQTSVGASLNYWFTSRLGANIDTCYSNNDQIDVINFAAGIGFHY